MPYIGSQIAQFSRQYFLTFAIVAGIVISAYDWALFKFDRVCRGEEGEASTGEFVVNFFGNTDRIDLLKSPITVESTDTVRVCKKDKCCQEVGFQWPPIPERFESEEFQWMSPGQQLVTRFFGWLSVVAVVVFFVGAFGHTIWTRFSHFFIGGIDVRESSIIRLGSILLLHWISLMSF